MAVESVGVLLPYIQQQFGYNFWKTSLPGIFFFLYDKMGRKIEIEVMAGKLGGGKTETLSHPNNLKSRKWKQNKQPK